MRAHEGKPMVVRGWITGLGEKLAPCSVQDISSDGAKLVISSGQPPDEFKLYFSPHAHTFRNCVVLWRSKERVGVQFCGASGAPAGNY
jgi:PilZ domain-containing protein